MKKLILAVCFTLAMVATAYAGTSTVNLAWDANIESDLAGYKLYQSTTQLGVYTVVQTLGKVTTTSVTSLPDGNYCWKLTAFDANNNESGFSNIVCFLADTTAPSAPKTLRIP